MNKYIVIDGGVSSPKGFLSSGIHSGVKKSGKNDLSLVYSEVPAYSWAMFTTNKACAAPVTLSKSHIQDQNIQAIVINSGNANACTGQKGLSDAYEMATVTASALNIAPQNVIVSSTGLIGLPLEMDKIKSGITKAVSALSVNGSEEAAKGIITTDAHLKTIAVQVTIDNKVVTIGGMAKGSRMIHPQMATMLSIITTDANIDKAYLKYLLNDTTEKTYNMISIDGDTSTNDMVAVMANCKACNNELNANHPEVQSFANAFAFVNEYLAKSIVADGEGATKFIEVQVVNSNTLASAKLAAKSILTSNLVKTSLFGEESNWGRILCSIGYSGAQFDMDKLDISLVGDNKEMIKIVENGQSTVFCKESAKKLLKERNITILVDFKTGSQNSIAWGCDLSHDYVKINSSHIS